jgi:hypothetical protein
MARNPIGVPHGREALDEIARRHNVHARLPNELERSGIDSGDVGNRAARRILHRDACHPVEQLPQAGFELIPARVARRRTGQVREGVLFNRVHQRARLALRGNKVVPPSRRQMAALALHRRNVGGNRIDAAEVVQQPAVQTVCPKGGLHGRHIDDRWRDGDLSGHPVQYSRLDQGLGLRG